MDSTIEEIKKKIDIVEYIGSFISLKKMGHNFKANCPFHREKTPSFVISPDRQIWHCFGACHEGGDIIKFLMKMENITFYEALKELAQKAGVPLKTSSFEDSSYQKKERLLQINTTAAGYFNYVLTKSTFGKTAMDYLSQRGMNEKMIQTFQLGYAPNSWGSLMNFLKKKKFTEHEIEETGLLVRSEKGGFYDRFRGRLMFPIFDTREMIVGFSGRVLTPDEKSAKYVNTPETFLYHKRDTLYGIQAAKDEIKKLNNVYIVEGEFDMLTPYQAGIANIVAIKGSALTLEQLTLLKRYTSRITLMLDADAAGDDAAKRGIEDAEALEFEIEAVSFDFAKDPDEAVRKDETKFKNALKQSMSIYDFVIRAAQRKYPENDAFSKKKVGEEVAVFLSRIKNPIVKSHYVKKLASILDVSERSIEELLYRAGRSKKRTFTPASPKKELSEEKREILLQHYLLSILFQDEKPYEIGKAIFEIVSSEDFSIPSHQEIVRLFVEYKDKNMEFNLKEFFTSLPPPLQAVFDELYLFATGQEGSEKNNIHRIILEVRRFSLKRQFTKFLDEDNGDGSTKDSMQNVKNMLNEVEKKLLTLYN